jgi:hypothetical protein
LYCPSQRSVFMAGQTRPPFGIEENQFLFI